MRGRIVGPDERAGSRPEIVARGERRFLSMTVKVSVASGRTVGMATDTERDFVGRARQRMALSLSHFDRENAERRQRWASQ